MSFRERSNALMLVVLLGVYGWYFSHIFNIAQATMVSEISYQPLLLVMVVVLVVVSVIGHIVIAVLPSYDGDESDERDKLINLMGERAGGLVLGVGTLAGLFLAMAEFQPFWIAHALLAGLVISELVSGAAKMYCYRRMG